MKSLSKKNNIRIASISIAVLILFICIFTVFRISEAKKHAGMQKAYYLAEAGLDRAKWYLNTPETEGGRGIRWRTNGMIENIEPGTYLITAKDSDVTGEVIVTSVGSFAAYSRTISQVLARNQFPPAFDYAVFSNSSLKLEGNCQIYGDVYGRGNIVIDFPAKILDGYAYTLPGLVVSGSGDYIVGGTNITLPVPRSDHSYYTERISAARSDRSGQKGDKLFNDLNLFDDIYVDGSVTITGRVNGSACITATKNIKIEGGIIDGSPRFIAGENLEMHNTASSDKNTIFYSTKDMIIKGACDLKGSLMFRSGKLQSEGTFSIRGPVFCGGESISMKGKTMIYGSIVSNKLNIVAEDVTIRYDASTFPEFPPPGMEAEIFGKKADSRKEF